MRNMIKRIIVGVAIGTILMFVGNLMPKAESYSKTSINNAVCASGYNCNSFNRNYIYYTFLQKNVISSENFRMNFDSINLVPYDGFKITTIMSEYNQEYFEIYNEYPTQFQWSGSLPESYTITYADGTQANVTGGFEISGYNSSSVDSVNYNYGTINDTTFAYQLNYISGDNTNNACIMESANNNQVTWNCPKTSSASEFNVTGLVLNVRYRTDADMTLYINRTDVLLYRNDGSRIITKIEQSTQSIIDAINNGNTGTQNAINSNTQATQEQTDTINSTNISGASSDADALKNNSAFNDTSGISSLITLPLRFVNNLGAACKPISLTIPYMNANMQLPCYRQIITNKMPELSALITLVVNGFLLYNIFTQIVYMIHNAKNPDDDRIEVVEL